MRARDFGPGDTERIHLNTEWQGHLLTSPRASGSYGSYRLQLPTAASDAVSVPAQPVLSALAHVRPLTSEPSSTMTSSSTIWKTESVTKHTASDQPEHQHLQFRKWRAASPPERARDLVPIVRNNRTIAPLTSHSCYPSGYLHQRRGLRISAADTMLHGCIPACGPPSPRETTLRATP